MMQCMTFSLQIVCRFLGSMIIYRTESILSNKLHLSYVDKLYNLFSENRIIVRKLV